MNTLADYRYHKVYKAQRGDNGRGRQCTGRGGEDCILQVPVGTLVYDNETDELIGDLVEAEQNLLVAQGGFHGIGNERFKSSTNRSPRQFTKGSEGEARDLRFELKLVADVGLLGMPNAGKSSLIRKVSAARPKVADYPFTTLHPNLGVVRVEALRSFVMADIPGIIEGASEGAGLGLRFLKHLSRTGLLLHMVDIAAFDDVDSPADAVRKIIAELQAWSAELANKPRWLVFNKVDAIDDEALNARCQEVVTAIDWNGPVFHISALSGSGLEALNYAIMEFIELEPDTDAVTQ